MKGDRGEMTAARTLPTTRWRLREGNQDAQELLVRELGLSPLISRILESRDICDPDHARRYLSPSLRDLHNPFLMQDMKKAVDRLIRAIYRTKKWSSTAITMPTGSPRSSFCCSSSGRSIRERNLLYPRPDHGGVRSESGGGGAVPIRGDQSDHHRGLRHIGS